MENSLVSIITPAYNSEKFIAQTIQSVQNQTYQNWEMIIVDDASSDQTISIITDFTKYDSRIQFFKLDKNSGTGVARNIALSKSKGRYISFLDADDLWKPEKLKTQIDFLTIKNLPLAFSYYDCIDENGKSLKKRVEAPLYLTYRQLFFCNYIGNLTGIYDVNYFGKIAISNNRKRQDWTLWLTILNKIRIAQVIPESLAFYRKRENSISATKLALLQHNFAVYRTFHGFNLVAATFCMVPFLFTQLLIKPFYSKKLK
jgi:glycosyltransferase involved in cell wall biosynthesis